MQFRSGNKAPGSSRGEAFCLVLLKTAQNPLNLLQVEEFILFDISVSLGHFSFTCSILIYILNDCYVTGKWHSYFRNYLFYGFISSRARRDYYNPQSRGQRSSPDDSSLQPSDFGGVTIHPCAERNPLTTRKHQMLEIFHLLRVPSTSAGTGCWVPWGCWAVLLPSHPESRSGAARAPLQPAPSWLS